VLGLTPTHQRTRWTKSELTLRTDPAIARCAT
jgi:hypothetical protein